MIRIRRIGDTFSRPPAPTVPDQVVYSFALRVALLADTLSAGPASLRNSPRPSTSASTFSSTSAYTPSHPSSPPLLGRQSSASSAASLGLRKDVSALWNKSLAKSIDLLKEVSGAVDHFPAVALRPLELRLSRISAGQDPSYPDRDFQEAVRHLQNKIVGEPFRTKFKREGNVEELILVFATAAQGVLRTRHPGAPASDWIGLLDPLIGQFAIVVRDCLKSLNISGEVLTRLEAHAKKFSVRGDASGRRLSSVSAHSVGGVADPRFTHDGLSLDISRMHMVQVVGQLFGQSQADLADAVDELRGRCDEKAAYNDLRRRINSVASGTHRSDFDADEAFTQWRKDENVELSNLLLELISRNPALRGAPDDFSGALVFIPPEPRATYARLVDFALNASPEEGGMPSPEHRELLALCASRWRVPLPAQVCALLESVVRAGAPMPCIDATLDELEGSHSTWEYSRWPWSERVALYASLRALFDSLLPRLAEIFRGSLDIPYERIVLPLERIYADEVFREDARDLSNVLKHLRGSVVGVVERGYAAKSASTKASFADAPPEKALEPMLSLMQWLMSECKRYAKAFPRPLFDTIDVAEIFISTAAPLFVSDLTTMQDALTAVATRAAGAASDADLLLLYNKTKELKKMHDAFSSEPLVIRFGPLFGAYVRRWLNTTADTMSKVCSSVRDIIDGSRAAIGSLLDLEWPDEIESAEFSTRLSQAIANSVQIYARQLEEAFVNELYPHQEEEGEQETWFAKARLAVQGGKPLVPFVFEPKLLVKLNNISAMRLLLDSLSASLNAETIGPLLEQHSAPIPPEHARNLFTVKIVSGERLVSSDGSRRKLDTYTLLSDLAGFQVARTRVAPETNDPRWEQSFDILVKELSLLATVYRKVPGDSPDVLGRARFDLNEQDFAPLARHDLALPLEGAFRQPAGPSRILLRVRREPEKNDINFFFGRAFRALKRTEKEMSRLIVGKMLPLIQAYLSLNTLRTLLRTSLASLIDIDPCAALTLGAKFNALLENKAEELIPDVINHDAVDTSSPVAEGRRGPPTPAEVQLQAIAPLEPLVDYLNDQLELLSNTLSIEAWAVFSGQLWRVILTTFENLFLPPLSDESTEMKPLNEKELDIVFRWLHFIVEFFHADGEGMELSALHGVKKYRELTLARMYYDMPSEDLRSEVVQSIQRQALKGPPSLNRTKSVYAQKNLRAIKEAKSEKAKDAEASGAAVILRILRMRKTFSKNNSLFWNVPPRPLLLFRVEIRLRLREVKGDEPLLSQEVHNLQYLQN
ncbi:hypothetical protein RQP46_006877 [Phenoliferia psychrophenolica]